MCSTTASRRVRIDPHRPPDVGAHPRQQPCAHDERGRVDEQCRRAPDGVHERASGAARSPAHHEREVQSGARLSLGALVAACRARASSSGPPSEMASATDTRAAEARTNAVAATATTPSIVTSTSTPTSQKCQSKAARATVSAASSRYSHVSRPDVESARCALRAPAPATRQQPASDEQSGCGDRAPRVSYPKASATYPTRSPVR